MRCILLVITCFIFMVSYSYSLRCMNENNKPVDWFIAYKLPKIPNGGGFTKYGEAYVYLTSDQYNSWTFSQVGIASPQSIIASTLNPLYKSPGRYMYIIYNDDPPSREGIGTKGHNKGMVAADNSGGFWLIHSTPKLGNLDDGEYVFPETGKIYGQTFICITLDLNNLDKVGQQLQYNEPDIYQANVLSTLESSLPELTKAAQNVTIKAVPWTHVTTLISKAGTVFTSFAKSRKFGQELYEDLVAPTLKADLLVESWRKGTGLLDSNCTRKYKVNNVQSVELVKTTFPTTQDHSKWAVSVINQKPWICVGDINRAEHQKVRGGGTLCFNNEPVVNIFRNSIVSIENCKNFWSKLWSSIKGTYNRIRS